MIHCKADEQLPAEFTGSYHVHLLMRRGEMAFSDGKNVFTSRKDDLVIWQMSNTIQSVTYSDDFEADLLLVSPAFLQQYNPEMVWASKGFLFIRINPSFHLDEESLRLMNADFGLFRMLDEHARFITGTDLLIDGGVIASIRTGEYQLG